MSGYYIVAAVLAGSLIWMIIYLRRKGRRCRWCMISTRKISGLPKSEHSNINRLITEEGMGFDVSSYEFCTNCKRVFDERWFARDWDIHDRWCACGWQLKLPWDVGTGPLREAVSHLPQGVITSLRDVYPKVEVERLLGGYSDMAYRVEKQKEEHVLFVCENCRRVYMWVSLRGYQVFQCVSPQYDKYDQNPRSPVKLLDSQGISLGADFRLGR